MKVKISTSSLVGSTRHLTGAIKIITLSLIIITLYSTPTSALTYQDSVDVSFTFAPTLSINLSSSNISIDSLSPGNYAHSNTVAINVSTNNVYGYTLTAKVGDNGGAGGNSGTSASSNLVNASTSTSFTSLASNDNLTLSNFSPNTWGYTTSSNINNSTTTYSGLLYNTDTILNQTIGSRGNAIGGYAGTDTTNFTIGANASGGQLAGDYSNIITFTVISNATPPPTLYELVAAMSKGKQTAADLQRPITAPTSSDLTTDTSNSGVFEYDPEVFGVASDASNDYRIYYYRGILDSAFASTDSYGNIGSSGNGGYYPNYVRLGNTCWRIVRTTGSGGVKMIYNGLYFGGTVSNSCANTTIDAQTSAQLFNSSTSISSKSITAVGYTFNIGQKTAANGTTYEVLFGTNNSYYVNDGNSSIKNYVENNWFVSPNGISMYSSILETSAGFCNDRTLYDSSGNIIENNMGVITPYNTNNYGVTIYYFGPRMRNMSLAQLPSLTCPRDKADLYTVTNDTTGNQQLTKPAALLTADEASLAGSGSASASQGSGYNVSSYLRSGSNFWLLSPALRYDNGYAHEFNLYAKGDLGMNGVSVSYGIRPVISLKSGISPTSGSGTATDPWIITTQ